jgi:hypothetical protein
VRRDENALWERAVAHDPRDEKALQVQLHACAERGALGTAKVGTWSRHFVQWLRAEERVQRSVLL